MDEGKNVEQTDNLISQIGHQTALLSRGGWALLFVGVFTEFSTNFGVFFAFYVLANVCT